MVKRRLPAGALVPRLRLFPPPGHVAGRGDADLGHADLLGVGKPVDVAGQLQGNLGAPLAVGSAVAVGQKQLHLDRLGALRGFSHQLQPPPRHRGRLFDPPQHAQGVPQAVQQVDPLGKRAPQRLAKGHRLGVAAFHLLAALENVVDPAQARQGPQLQGKAPAGQLRGCQQLESAAERADGLLVLTASQGLLAGLKQVLHRRPGRSCSVVVMGDRLAALLQAVGAQLFDGLGDAPVELRAALRREALVHGLLDEGMTEAEGVTRSARLLVDPARLLQLAESRPQIHPRGENPLQHLPAEELPHRRGALQRLLGHRPQPVHPGLHQAQHGLGDPFGRRRRRRTPGLCAGPGTHDLFDEQGVAAALALHGLRQPGWKGLLPEQGGREAAAGLAG